MNKAGKRPEPRTTQVQGEGEFETWEMVARVDFPARILLDFQSKDPVRILDAASAIVVSHNFPDSSGEVAATMADVDPFRGVASMLKQLAEAIASLPPR